MKITERPDLQAKLVRDLQEKNVKDRSDIHLSDLDGCLRKAFYRRTARIEPTEKQLMMYFLGWAVQHEAVGDDEMECKLDGIAMSFDSVAMSPFVEFKTTRQSLKNFKAEDHAQWMQRIKAYARAGGEQSALLAVVFLNGDYKPPLPLLRVYALEFTEEELAVNWQVVLEKRDILVKYLGENCPPPYEEARYEEWECETCENNCPGRCFGHVKKPKEN